MENTSFKIIIERFLRLIENDRDFFEYYNISLSEIQNLAYERALGYLYDSIDLLMSQCEADVDFYDYDEDIGVFNFKLTNKEIGLLASLMREVYFERDEALLSAFKVRMSPSDLTQFSPANERTSFENMLNNIRNENVNKIKQYVSTNRSTNKRKFINYGSYDYS